MAALPARRRPRGLKGPALPVRMRGARWSRVSPPANGEARYCAVPRLRKRRRCPCPALRVRFRRPGCAEGASAAPPRSAWGARGVSVLGNGAGLVMAAVPGTGREPAQSPWQLRPPRAPRSLRAPGPRDVLRSLPVTGELGGTGGSCVRLHSPVLRGGISHGKAGNVPCGQSRLLLRGERRCPPLLRLVLVC